MATWYINADSGNDTTGDGSSVNPWKTFQEAYNNASGSDTIILQAATATYDFPNITSFSKTLTVQGATSAATSVFDAGLAFRSWLFTANTNLTVDKITFQNIQFNTAPGWMGPLGAGPSVITYNDCIFKGLEAETRGMFGADAAAVDVTWTLNRCLIHDCGRTTTGNAVIIHLQPGSNGANYTFSFNNVTIFNKRTTQQLTRIVTANNANNATINVKNTIIRDSQNLLGWSGGGGVQPDFNITYSCINNLTTIPTLGTGSISSDPLFVDEENANFNLRPTSPCIDTGVLV